VGTYHAHFDESYGGKYTDGPFCAAGYVFTELKLRRLEAQWKRMLDRYQVPYMHMSILSHLKAPFKGFSREKKDALDREAAGIIRANAACGFAVAVDQALFRQIADLGRLNADRYEFSAWMAVMLTTIWRQDTNAVGTVNYVFEAGDTREREVAKIMNLVRSDPVQADIIGSGSLSFAAKADGYGCQAADMLAYLWFRDVKRRVESPAKPPRKDLAALVERKTRVFDADANLLFDMIEGLRRMYPPKQTVA